MTPLYTEILDFLASQPSHQDILAFKVSPEAQARLRELLDRSRDGLLTEAETQELDDYQQLEHLMILLKARAVELNR